MVRSHRHWLLAAAVLLTAAPGAVYAQNAPAAQALFDQGAALMKARKYEEACPKLEESVRLDKSGGSLLYLGICHARTGKLATAWAELKEAQGMAQLAKRKDREKAATDELAQIEAKLTTLVVLVPEAVGTISDLVVERDGVPIGKAQWGIPIPVDPGKHEVVARAPGKKTWKVAVEAPYQKSVQTVTVPALEAEVPTTAMAPVVSPAVKVDEPIAPSALAPEPPPPRPMSTPPPVQEEPAAPVQRMAGLGMMGLGALSVGTGVVLRVRALGRQSDAEAACPNNVCSSDDGVTAWQDAATFANASTVALVGGAVLAGGGAIVYLTAPKANEGPTADVAVGLGRVVVSGTF